MRVSLLSCCVASTLLFFMNLVVMATEISPASGGSCVKCHQEIHEKIVADFKEDIHNRNGIGCNGCHGGNPSVDDETAMDKKYGFIGAPKRDEVPQFCGKCHSDPAFMRPYNQSLPTDQVEKYWTSRHGELAKKKDLKVATCTSCHKTHGILPANDPRSSVYPLNVPKTCAACHADAAYMAPYGIPTNQYQQYTDSSNVHGYALFIKNDLGAPACNDCHGNHGAAPPGVTEVGQVCTQCHAMNGQLFRDSPHKDAFDALTLPECAFCHQASPDLNNPRAHIHTIVHPTKDLVGTDKGAVCVQCHSQGDDGFALATEVHADLDSLNGRLERVESLISKAEQQGMEVSDARWKLKSEVLQSKMELRTSIHAFNPATFKSAFQKADTSLNGVMSLGIEAQHELAQRRAYYLVMTIVIALFAIALAIKIRSISRERK
jgi:predicted CXXCH cytochrome family protein